jgi:hypothetical protein
MAASKKQREVHSRRQATKSARHVRVKTNQISEKFQDVVTLANEIGLFVGARTELIRGRMPKALVEKAKARTGIQSDTELIEVALANLAVADEFPNWLLAQKASISKDLDLEF